MLQFNMNRGTKRASKIVTVSLSKNMVRFDLEAETNVSSDAETFSIWEGVPVLARPEKHGEGYKLIPQPALGMELTKYHIPQDKLWVEVLGEFMPLPTYLALHPEMEVVTGGKPVVTKLVNKEVG